VTNVNDGVEGVQNVILEKAMIKRFECTVPSEQESEGNNEGDESAMLPSQHHTAIADHDRETEEQIRLGTEGDVRQPHPRRRCIHVPSCTGWYPSRQRAARNRPHKTQQKPRHCHRQAQHRRHTLQIRHDPTPESLTAHKSSPILSKTAKNQLTKFPRVPYKPGPHGLCLTSEMVTGVAIPAIEMSALHVTSATDLIGGRHIANAFFSFFSGSCGNACASRCHALNAPALAHLCQR